MQLKTESFLKKTQAIYRGESVNNGLIETSRISLYNITLPYSELIDLLRSLF